MADPTGSGRNGTEETRSSGGSPGPSHLVRALAKLGGRTRRPSVGRAVGSATLVLAGVSLFAVAAYYALGTDALVAPADHVVPAVASGALVAGGYRLHGTGAGPDLVVRVLGWTGTGTLAASLLAAWLLARTGAGAGGPVGPALTAASTGATAGIGLGWYDLHRRRLRRESDRDRRRFEGIIEGTPAPVFVSDLSRDVVVEANAAARELLGRNREAVVGADPAERHPPTERDRYRDLVEGCLDAGGTVRRQWPDGDRIHVRTAAGEDVPVEVGARVVELEGQPHAVEVVRDVTDHVDRERELRRRNRRLDRFAGIVAHDLRNPLEALTGAVELAAESGDQRHFDICRNTIDRMHRLIDDLLALARSGNREMDPAPVDLAEAAETCWRAVDAPGAELVVVTDRTVLADETALCRAFENLFRNSVEHGGEDATVTVGDLDGGFYVADDGPGVPAEEREKVFELGHSTGGGTGIGLSIVQSVAEASDWGVRVVEGEAGGARFEFTGVETPDR